MTTVNIHEAKTHLSRLLERAQAGERIVIAKAGVPIAELGPLRKREVIFGGLRDVIEVDYEEFEAADAEVAEMWKFNPANG